jgi:hypothetical protein
MMPILYMVCLFAIPNPDNAASYFIIGKLSRSHLGLDLIDESWVLEADLGSANRGQITSHGRLFFFPQQPHQQCLLRVHAVFGLLEDDTAIAVEDVAGHFFAAMGRKTVHNSSVGWG